MAPLPASAEVQERAISSLNLPAYLQSLSLSEREALTNPSSPHAVVRRNDLLISSPIQARHVLLPRSTTLPTGPLATGGAIPPESINMKGIQALFALIGASFVLGSIWFFFWAKNGGFHFRKGDWEDYKTTVLRRKGPNGTTLSNATKSTRLGGGSVVGRGYSDADGMTDFSSEAPIVSEKKRAKNQKAYLKKLRKENAREQKVRESKEAGWEGGHDDDVRAYRHEKVARVGGLNKDSEAMHYGTDYSQTEPSVSQPPHRPGRDQRQQSSSRHASPEKKPNRRGEDATGPQRPARYHSPSKDSQRPNHVPGAFGQPMDWDVQSQNTKAYHHPMPGPQGQKKAGGGFRRGRGDDLDD